MTLPILIVLKGFVINFGWHKYVSRDILYVVLFVVVYAKSSHTSILKLPLVLALSHVAVNCQLIVIKLSVIQDSP